MAARTTPSTRATDWRKVTRLTNEVLVGFAGSARPAISETAIAVDVRLNSSPRSLPQVCDRLSRRTSAKRGRSRLRLPAPPAKALTARTRRPRDRQFGREDLLPRVRPPSLSARTERTYEYTAIDA